MLDSSRLELVAVLAASILVATLFPVAVYITYPDVRGYEPGLEEVLSEDLVLRPPRFLVGSANSVLYRGRSVEALKDSSFHEHTQRARHLVVFTEREGRAILVLLPHYLDRASGALVSGEELAKAIRAREALLVVEFFETHRGRVGVVVEVKLEDREYVALRASRR
ncbi:MAG: hypothetical protein QXS85_02990 [Acidilobaceae archaeon]